MSYTIIIILITAMIVAGIAASAVQQHNERKEQLKREEISKYKHILEETEMGLASTKHLPVSQHLISLLKLRSLKALKGIHEQSPMPELLQRIQEMTKGIEQSEVASPAPALDSFTLPSSDKVIIKYIQAVKRLRSILRSELNHQSISTTVFYEQDKLLEQLQLRINVETLNKRSSEAINNKMQGSARQYLEKAIRALSSFKPQDEYTQSRCKELKLDLYNLENSLRDKNREAVLDAQNAESQELEELFAPKKKW